MFTDEKKELNKVSKLIFHEEKNVGATKTKLEFHGFFLIRINFGHVFLDIQNICASFDLPIHCFDC